MDVVALAQSLAVALTAVVVLGAVRAHHLLARREAEEFPAP